MLQASYHQRGADDQRHRQRNLAGYHQVADTPAPQPREAGSFLRLGIRSIRIVCNAGASPKRIVVRKAIATVNESTVAFG